MRTFSYVNLRASYFLCFVYCLSGRLAGFQNLGFFPKENSLSIREPEFLSLDFLLYQIHVQMKESLEYI